MIKIFIRRLSKSERGASLVEFALVVPILIALFFGLIEFGWIFNGWITLTSSAREGARVAAVTRLDGPVIDAVEKHLEFSALTGVEVDIDRDSENDVVVEVKGAIQPLVGFYVSGLVELNSQGVMRREYADAD